MPNLEHVKVGDTLILCGVNRRNDRTRTVTVHRVGRTLIHILKHPNQPDGATETFNRKDGRQSNSAYQHEWLTTHELYEAGKRRNALEKELKAHGLEQRMGHAPLSLSKMERILSAMEEPDDAPLPGEREREALKVIFGGMSQDGAGGDEYAYEWIMEVWKRVVPLDIRVAVGDVMTTEDE